MTVVRERFFTPRLRFKSYDELNGWLIDQCVVYAKAHQHPALFRHAAAIAGPCHRRSRLHDRAD
jgi:hypothetical protein